MAEEEKPEKVASQAKENEEVVVYAALLRDPVFPAEEAMLKLSILKKVQFFSSVTKLCFCVLVRKTTDELIFAREHSSCCCLQVNIFSHEVKRSTY